MQRFLNTIMTDGLCCPLCNSREPLPFFEDTTRAYLRCCRCLLIFVPEQYWLSAEEEKARYDLHENIPEDTGYRRFLSRLTTPLLERLQSPKHGLDFGCGPGPTLSVVMEEHGHQMKLFDPYYCNTPSVLQTTYDFICATEVVEHVRRPDQVFITLFSLLEQGGWLGIMTKLVDDDCSFGTWHYTRDMTHICFYHRETFSYVADRFGAELTFIGRDVILLRKDAAASP